MALYVAFKQDSPNLNKSSSREYAAKNKNVRFSKMLVFMENPFDHGTSISFRIFHNNKRKMNSVLR